MVGKAITNLNTMFNTKFCVMQDEYGFLCNVCHIFFPAKNIFLEDVRDHFRNPHNEYENPFKCQAPDCEYETLRYSRFKDHLDANHPNGKAMVLVSVILTTLNIIRIPKSNERYSRNRS